MEYKIKKGRNYLIAVNYGATSMSLLSWLLKKDCKPICVYVDYHEAPSGAEDLEALKHFCAEKGLIIEVCETRDYPRNEGESYSEWARRVRYDFFKSIYKKYDAAAMFIAHIQDDVLETYLLQKQSTKKVEHYGLNEINSYQGMITVRPLLPYTMDDVYDHLRENGVPYSEAMTRFEAEHTHSDIRKNVVDKMGEVERGQLLDEINVANNERLAFFKHMEKQAEMAEELSIREIIALDEDEFAETLIGFVSRCEDEVVLSAERIAEIRAMCLNGKLFDSMHLAGNSYLIKQYDVLELGKNPKVLPYQYTLEAPGKLETKEFTLDFSMGAEDRGIKPDDYPITIRTALPADLYVVGDYLYFVKSLFSDWKMPTEFRRLWPVFVNNKKKIVYVPTFRRDFVEYHTSVFKLHLEGLSTED